MFAEFKIRDGNSYCVEYINLNNILRIRKTNKNEYKIFLINGSMIITSEMSETELKIKLNKSKN